MISVLVARSRLLVRFLMFFGVGPFFLGVAVGCFCRRDSIAKLKSIYPNKIFEDGCENLTTD